MKCRGMLAVRSAARKLSTKSPGPMEADAGPLATRTHHAMTTSLAFLTPIYFLVPDSMTEGLFNKAFGVFLAGNISAHSWIGLNYVATDYVPKVSRALQGPARIVNAGMAIITFVGLARIATSSPGGIKGAVKGLWNPDEKMKMESTGKFKY
jgi:succinate dehydrogenase hydrophobic anchor subunit